MPFEFLNLLRVLKTYPLVLPIKPTLSPSSSYKTKVKNQFVSCYFSSVFSGHLFRVLDCWDTSSYGAHSYTNIYKCYKENKRGICNALSSLNTLSYSKWPTASAGEQTKDFNSGQVVKPGGEFASPVNTLKDVLAIFLCNGKLQIDKKLKANFIKPVN